MIKHLIFTFSALSALIIASCTDIGSRNNPFDPNSDGFEKSLKTFSDTVTLTAVDTVSDTVENSVDAQKTIVDITLYKVTTRTMSIKDTIRPDSIELPYKTDSRTVVKADSVKIDSYRDTIRQMDSAQFSFTVSELLYPDSVLTLQVSGLSDSLVTLHLGFGSLAGCKVTSAKLSDSDDFTELLISDTTVDILVLPGGKKILNGEIVTITLSGLTKGTVTLQEISGRTSGRRDIPISVKPTVTIK